MNNQTHIIAILRGITTGEVSSVFEALIDAGITMIEIPLNSPDALTSIAMAQKAFGGTVRVGAGTVLSIKDVDAVADTGATFIVSPNCNQHVIEKTVSAGLSSYPGVLTPSEAFCAIDAGANALKIFPAQIIGPSGIKAMKAVLPSEIPVYAVGGAEPGNFVDYFSAGCAGFGLGSYLYRPGMSAKNVGEKARIAFDAFHNSNS